MKKPKRPVVYVSYDDAKAFVAWADKRLPYEAKWEYAARGGNTGLNGKPHYKYPWGNEADEKKANFRLSSFHNVRSYPQNGYGLYDIVGNVWEWCEDWYSSNYYKMSRTRNPKDPASRTLRVQRGGSWILNPPDLRCALRLRNVPANRLFYVGFRCAQDVR